MHASASVARFIEQEVARPSKQWITHIIEGTQEKDEVIHRAGEFVLLPDTERVNRYWRIACNSAGSSMRTRPKRILNWLAIASSARSATSAATTSPCCARCSTSA